MEGEGGALYCTVLYCSILYYIVGGAGVWPPAHDACHEQDRPRGRRTRQQVSRGGSRISRENSVSILDGLLLPVFKLQKKVCLQKVPPPNIVEVTATLL